MRAAWFLALFSAICLEGLGRKYLPGIPVVAFYFLKDVILLFGYFRFRPARDITRVSSSLYRGFGLYWMVAFGWTIIQVFNPDQESLLLGLIGVRAYWLWWMAPMVIAAALHDEKNKTRAIYVLLIVAIGISAFAIVQFASPPTAAVNLYSVVDGKEIYADMATVHSTGRARVASTFSFITGFSDFTVLVPTLLLSLGLEARDRRLRWPALAATCFTAAVIPMAGSRSSVLLGGAVLVVTAWTAGLFVTRLGRRVLIGGIAAAAFAVFAFPDAIFGVQSRFEDEEETTSRFRVVAESLIPPLAIADTNSPFGGIGTGMQQNATGSMHIYPKMFEEPETRRYLVELGVIGFLVVWVAKVGLIVALLRASKILKRAGRRGAAAAAVSYALLTPNGNLTFDHIWQALYFTGCGFILAEVVAVVRHRVGAPAEQPAVADATVQAAAAPAFS